MTKQQLVAAGFKYFTGGSVGKQFASGLYQKRVRNDAGVTLYFIDVYEYDLTGFVSDAARARLTYGPEACLYGKDHDCRVEMLVCANTTPEQVEAFYATAYKRLKCVPDKHNQ